MKKTAREKKRKRDHLNVIASKRSKYNLERLRQDKLAHMKHVLQETLDQDGLIQIVNCKNDYGQISNGFKDAFQRKDGDAMRACEKTLENFACVQKGTGRGWVTLDESIKAEMARNGVQPDTWIVPPGMKSFGTTATTAAESM